MRESWTRAWAELAVSAPADDPVLTQILAAYSEPHRKYHTLQHLSECLGWLEPVLDQAEHPGEVEIALWFHDAVYALERQDNELRSAEWANAELIDRGVDSEVRERVGALVMATKHAAPPQTTDERLLVDVDLAILGAPRERFDEYEKQIRAEYGWVPGFLFRRKRREVLAGFLARPVLLSSAYFRERLEESARANLQRSIASLGSG
jgi:predicted metal-dependent HD superfamily phosphohydrolase